MSQTATPSQVITFGDSWAAYPLVRKTWPMQLADLVGTRALNFAVPGSRTDQLLDQVQAMLTSPNLLSTQTGDLDPQTVVVIHTAGNDFMQRMGVDLMQQLPGKTEADLIRMVMDCLHEAGVRPFLVSDVPFASVVPGVRMASPMIQSFVDSGRMEHLGIEPGDSAELLVELQATALHDQWGEMLADFQKERSDSAVVHFDEAFALTRLREKLGAAQFDSRFFDMTLIHPSDYGHELLAQEAYRCMKQCACC